MLRQPQVSVVIPVYNEEEYIEQCLQAITKQTHPIDEIIIVDNNCTDSTIEIIMSLKLKQVQIVEEKRQGMVVARKYGFDTATGDVIMTIDADTIVDPNWAKKIIERMKEKDADAVSCHVDGYGDAPLLPLGMFLFNISTFGVNRVLLGHGMLFGSTYAVQQKTWSEVREQLRSRNDIWEDLDLSLAIGSQGGTISVIKERLASISIRSARVPLKNLHKRFYEWPRTYWSYDKLAAIASIPVVYIILAYIGAAKSIDWLFNRFRKDS